MDEKIIQCANELIKAITDSGRSVMRPDVGKDFGHINIWILSDGELQVEHSFGIECDPYTIRGKVIKAV